MLVHLCILYQSLCYTGLIVATDLGCIDAGGVSLVADLGVGLVLTLAAVLGSSLVRDVLAALSSDLWGDVLVVGVDLLLVDDGLDLLVDLGLWYRVSICQILLVVRSFMPTSSRSRSTTGVTS